MLKICSWMNWEIPTKLCTAEKDHGDRDLPVVLNGSQSISVEVLSPNSSCQVPIVLLALERGVQTIQGLTLIHESDGYEYGGVEPIQIFVAQIT